MVLKHSFSVVEEELDCSQEITKALHDCAVQIPIAHLNNKLILAQIVEKLARSLEILSRIKEKSTEN